MSMSYGSNKTGVVLPFPGASPAEVSLPSPAPLLPVLIVLHQENSTPGRVGNALRALGRPLDIRRPRFGDSLPETLDDHAGAVIFGGPMSANDDDDYLRREIDWIEIPLRERRPFLGICLGAQMLAKQLGARVAPHPEGRTQIGYYPIRPPDAGRALCPNWPDHVYHWHREGFELPRDTELLAEGDDFPVQAFQLGHAFGFQFHPDVTYAMMHCWTTRGHDRMAAPGARPRHHHFADRAMRDVVERAWLKQFHRWLAGARAAVDLVGSGGISRLGDILRAPVFVLRLGRGTFAMMEACRSPPSPFGLWRGSLRLLRHDRARLAEP